MPIEPTDRILDIGCGTGKSTRDAARRAWLGSVLGVDLSSRMLDDARRRSEREGLPNVDCSSLMPRSTPSIPTPTTSRSVSSARCLRRSGRRVLQHPTKPAPGWADRLPRLAALEDNEWLTANFDALAAGRELPTPQSGSPGPFGLADPDAVPTLLRAAGFVDEQLLSFTEPMWVGADADDAWTFVSEMGFVRGLTDGLSDHIKTRSMSQLRTAIIEHETDDGVLFDSAAWLITAGRD